MAGSSLIPGVLDDIVKEEIIPRLPWHTRPILFALSEAWKNRLEAIGVHYGQRLHNIYGSENKIDPINGEPMATKTRLKQPLKCRLAVEYSHTYRNRVIRFIKPGHVVKIFDGQWRNVPPIRGRGPYTFTSPVEGHYSITGTTLGVVDGALFYVEFGDSVVTTTKIFALDIGGGLWQWQIPYEREDYSANLDYICRSGRVSDGHFVSHRDVGSHFEISELPAWLTVSSLNHRGPKKNPNLVLFSPQPMLVHIKQEHTLYFFGAFSYTQNFFCFDLKRSMWHHLGLDLGNIKVLKSVLLVGYDGADFHILRYSTTSARWKRAGRMPSQSRDILKWTWCVEYNSEGEKQLWIYIWLQDFSMWKSQVADKLVGGGPIQKVWDDMVVPADEVVCPFVNWTRIDRSFEPVEPFNDGIAPTLSVHALYGFHRSDLPNFQDIP